MAPRSCVRLSLPFVYSLFVYVTRIRKITVALLTGVLLSNPVAAAALGAAPIAANKGQDLRYEFYSNGWAKFLGFDLTSSTQGSGKGWDGRGAPKRNRPAVARAETKADRETKVARIKIYPGDVEIATGEHVIFTAVGFDSDGNAIGGLDVNWECMHEDKGKRITVRRGSFSSPIAGKFIITAEIAGRREQVRVTVKGKSVLPKVKNKSEIKFDSRELRRNNQVSRFAPSQHSGGSPTLREGASAAKRLIAGKTTAAQTLRASSKSMARVPRVALLEPDQDQTGWNQETVATFSNVGAERGEAPGRAPSAGIGSGNFQITASGVSLNGRGIEINLPLHYNSRLWHKSGATMYFDIDRDTLVAGWNIGFGKIVMPGNQYILIDADGTRHEFSGITDTSYGWFQFFSGRATDGTFIDYSAFGYRPGFGPTDGKNILSAWAYLPDGTAIQYGAPGNYAIYPTRITDAHGNYITITYRNNQGPQIETITDTLGRVIQFHYNGGNLLTAITVPGLNGGPARQVVRFAYQYLTLSDAGSNYGFSGVSTVVRQNTIPVLLGIYYPATGNGYWFGDSDSYSRYGMIRKVSWRNGMTFSGGLNEQGNMQPGGQTRVQYYENPSSPGYSDIVGFLSDTPTYTQMREDWWGRQTDSIPVTYFSVEDNGDTRKTTVTRPDGVRNVQITDKNLSSSSYSLMIENIVYPASSDTPLARSRTYFENGAYDSPRPARSEAFDERGQMTITTFGYASRFNAPTDAREYGYAGQLLKRVHTEYLNDDNYNGWATNYGGRIGRHIFNLVSAIEVYAGDDATRVSRVENEYDGKPLTPNPGVTHHDISYDPSAPQIEVCEWVSDPNDPDCTPGQCQELPCEEGGRCPNWQPPECDGNCNQTHECHMEEQYNPTTWYRGNVTRVTRYANAASLDGGSAVVENLTYDITGNLRVQSTSCCEQATFNYTTNTQYAWPESMVRGSASAPAAQNTTSAVYDFNTGLVMEAYDANNRRSNTVYNANSLRPEYGYLPTGAYVYHIYNDAGLYTNDVVYEKDHGGADFASRVDTQFDGRGQVIYEAAFGKDYVRDAVESVYDNLGRLWKRSRPFKEVANPQKQWAVTEYDSMDRPVRGASPDGSVTQNFYNESSYPSAATSNAGQTVRSRDAWGRERWARLDEQNRLVEVVEPNPSGDGAVASGGMSTQFYYDTLGNLTQINQGAQTRRFRYDSLGRLTHQKLAERAATLDDNGTYVGGGTWSDVFAYDKRSNLTIHADARGVRTYFHYDNDPLNRLQWVQYNKDTAPSYLAVDIPGSYGVSYPNINVVYSYMTTGDKMRVRTVGLDAGMGNQTIDYDVEGRVSQVYQTFGGRASYPLVTNYLWDTLGRIKEVRYPQQYGAGEARKLVTHNYDIASRLTELKYGGVTMASNPVYNASDQITSLAVGNQITENYNFDPKTGLLLSQQVNKGPEQLLNLQYNYTLNNDPNNNGAKTGQLTSVTDLKNTARNQAYEYDKLGRLGKVKGGANAFNNPTWYQSHTYDRYGNRSMVEQNGEAVWVDDATPAGATAGSNYEGGNWTWVGWSPSPYSGAVSHQSLIYPSLHQHYFDGASQTLQVNAGDKLYAYVYLDSASTPSEVMLQWNENGSWDHRAYWGANNIGWGVDGTESRRYMGPLPAAGAWVRLEVPASAVGLEGKTLNGMAFTLYGGRANWDRAGKAGGAGEMIWADDALPAGAIWATDGGVNSEGWSWVGYSPSPHSGAVSSQSAIAPVLHQHWFSGASQTLQVNAGDKLYAYVYLDPANTPSEVMLQWYENGSWDHRAYWGANNISWGTDGTESRRYMGPLPAAGGWVKLEVPALAVGLEGKTLNGMAFTLYGGRAWWDKAGKTRGIAATKPLDGLANIAYNPTNNRISTAGFAYDAAGNQTRAVVDATGRQQVSQYDCAGRLARTLDGNGVELARYVYGAGAERLMSIEGGVTTFYAMAGGQVMAEYEASGTNALRWKMSCVYMGGRLLATEQVEGIRYHHPDRLGTRLVTDASDGAVISEQLTMPFGTQVPYGSTLGGDNSWQHPGRGNLSKKRFTSYDRSDATGMDYAVNRFYSPQQGRFTQVDPIGMGAVNLGNPQSLNLYSYVQNDAVNATDPSGLMMSFCGAEYSFEECGGWDGFWGGNFGGDVAEYNREYGGMPEQIVDSLREYNERVANARAGKGFITNKEIEAFEAFLSEHEESGVNPLRMLVEMGIVRTTFPIQGGGEAAAIIEWVIKISGAAIVGALAILGALAQEGDRPHSRQITLFRYADGTNPGTFRIDPDGVSVFEIPSPDVKYNIPFWGKLTGPRVPGATIKIDGIPGLIAEYTPTAERPDHWSLRLPGVPDANFKSILSQYAKGVFGLLKK